MTTTLLSFQLGVGHPKILQIYILKLEIYEKSKMTKLLGLSVCLSHNPSNSNSDTSLFKAEGNGFIRKHKCLTLPSFGSEGAGTQRSRETGLFPLTY